MSAFIGPIHYWLYGKIKVVSEREELIYQKAYEMCGATAEEFRDQVWQTYGRPLPDSDLGELIDHTNIHGWLQRQINIAESREAAFINELLNMCGGAAEDLIDQAFAKHGKACGQDAAASGKYDTNTAPGIYKALNDYYLNGMPCDQADMVSTSADDNIVWETGKCLQEPNWKRVGVDSGTMAAFYKTWLQTFVEGVNSSFVLKQTGQADSAAGSRYEISRK